MDLSAVLRHAVEAGASDVHLKVGQPPVLRSDGELAPAADFGVLGDADLTAVLDQVAAAYPRRRELFDETGDLDIAYSEPGLPRFRVNGFRQRGAISFAFRLIPDQIPGFDDLHLPPGVARLAREQRGLVLVTGATGSGKTTTLAAMLDEINRTRRQHIVTIEDPIEVLHPDRSCIVNQREVGLDTESFERGAATRAPAGPGRDPHRRAARRRDGAGRRSRPPSRVTSCSRRSTRWMRRDDQPHGRVLPAREAAAGGLILAGVLRGVVSQRLLPASGVGASRPSR